jgi:hypothetical protein
MDKGTECLVQNRVDDFAWLHRWANRVLDCESYYFLACLNEKSRAFRLFLFGTRKAFLISCLSGCSGGEEKRENALLVGPLALGSSLFGCVPNAFAFFPLFLGQLDLLFGSCNAHQEEALELTAKFHYDCLKNGPQPKAPTLFMTVNQSHGSLH